MHACAHEVFLISLDDAVTWNITRQLVQHDYTVTTSACLAEALGKVYEAPPALIIVHEPALKGKALRLLKDFKKDNLFAHIPVVLLVPPGWEKKPVDWSAYPVEDYLTTAFTGEELLNRVALCVSRFNRALDPNPLTRLPGNTSILREIQRGLDLRLPLAFCYLDIDTFKAFNDTYGFARGDEALRMTARILSNSVRGYKSEDIFVGHVGGDDFVFIVPADGVEDICTKTIAAFDSIIPSLYDEQARKKGCIVARDRQEKKQTFPLMSISIAVVKNDHSPLKHYGEVSEIASQIKKAVKKKPGSNYLIDRRKL
jgi:diguanylate cyclase (GGDEF)-like protein